MYGTLMMRTGLRSAVVCGLVLLAACGGGGKGSKCPAQGQDVPDVSGDWLVRDLDLRSSNCPAAVDEILEDLLDTECVFEISQDGARISALDCDDLTFTGCVDEDGNVEMSNSQVASQSGCRIQLNTEIAADLSTSPSDATITLGIVISGRCTTTADCTAVIDADMTELVGGASAAVAGGPGLPGGLFDRLPGE